MLASRYRSHHTTWTNLEHMFKCTSSCSYNFESFFNCFQILPTSWKLRRSSVSNLWNWPRPNYYDEDAIAKKNLENLLHIFLHVCKCVVYVPKQYKPKKLANYITTNLLNGIFITLNFFTFSFLVSMAHTDHLWTFQRRNPFLLRFEHTRF